MRAAIALALIIAAGWWTGLTRALTDGRPLYAAMLDIALVGLCAWVAVSWFRRRGGRDGDSILALLILGYMGLAAIEILNPNVPDIVLGLEGYRKTAFTMVAFFGTALLVRQDERPFFRVIAIGSAVAMVWGIRQFFLPLPIEVDIVGTADASLISFHSGATLRAFSPTSGPFHFGILSGSIAIISLVLGRENRWWIALGCIAGVALGLSLTRANIGATLVALAALVVLAHPSWLVLRRAVRSGVIVGAIVFGLALGTGLLGDPPVSAVREALETPRPAPSAPGATPLPAPSASQASVGEIIEGVTDPLSDTKLQFRFEYWAHHVRAIGQSPLVGYGTSSAGDGFGQLYAKSGSKHFDPHSLYLKPALELGIVGLVLLVAILGRALWLAVRQARIGSRVGLIATGLIVLVGVSGLTGPMLDAYPFNVLLWATVGWVANQASSTKTPVAQPKRSAK